MSNSRRRYYRTIFLGSAAMAVLIWSAVDQFGIPWEEMLSLFMLVLAGIAVVIAVAGITVALWVGLRAVLRRWRG
ncbi:MAG: hypothetical protein Hals2KO_00460 [Halioglobus sp.]